MAIENQRTVLRVVVAHPEAAIRDSLIEAARRQWEVPISATQTVSVGEGVERSRQINPRVVFLDLGGDRGLALDAARAVRREGRLVVGVYNPLVHRGSEAELFRLAARAGVDDFVATPVADAEIGELATRLGLGQEASPREARTAAFVGHTGGFGATTLAVNTALMLAGSDSVNEEVGLCDASLPFGDAAAFLGLTPEKDLSYVADDLDSPGALAAYMATDPRTGLRVLACPSDPARALRITPELLSRVLLLMRRRFGYLVVDAPSGLDRLTLSVLDLCETVFVVTEAVTPSILATGRYLRALDASGIAPERVRVIVNRQRSGEANLAEGMVVDQLRRSVDHIFPYDEALVTAATSGQPLLLHKRAGGFVNLVSQVAEDLARGPR